MLFPPELFIIRKPDDKELDIYENTDLEDVFIDEIDTDFHNLKIVKNKIGKFIMFDETYQAGFLDTSFYKGNLPYINYFLLAYILNPKIKKILLIGMGTGKVINDFEKLMPDLKKIDIVDIDPTVFKVAQEHFGFKKSEITDFHIQDGRVFLRNSKTKYDLIIVDVAGNEGIPFRYMTEEFLMEANQKLTPKGTLIANMFSSAEFNNSENYILKSFLKTYKKVFKNVSIFKADYSDKIFYKTFFNCEKRIIDITNALFFASNSLNPINISHNFKDFIEKFEKIDLENIQMYVRDIFKEDVFYQNIKTLKDSYINDSNFYVENFNNYVKLEK